MRKVLMMIGLAMAALLMVSVGFAASGSPVGSGTIGDLAGSATTSVKPIIGFILALCYIIGLVLIIIAIIKLKANKDASTQVPISTGIVYLFLGAALLFLPTLIGAIGKTVFGAGSSPTMVDYTGSINIGSTTE